ncbi:MAG: hypothetical protein ACKOEM_07025 [Planctomycetia bacterium]
MLHFLRDESQIGGYFDNLRAVLQPGGFVLLAEFSATGAARCAGLDVHRYSVEEMARRLGHAFELVRADDVTFVNPSCGLRPCVYGLFHRT